MDDQTGFSSKPDRVTDPVEGDEVDTDLMGGEDEVDTDVMGGEDETDTDVMDGGDSR